MMAVCMYRKGCMEGMIVCLGVECIMACAENGCRKYEGMCRKLVQSV